MSKPKIEINEGEFRVTFDTPFSDNLTLKDLGFEDDQLKVAGGNLRFVIELGHSDTLHFFKVPTIEFTYYEKIGPSTWQVEFNGELMKRKRRSIWTCHHSPAEQKKISCSYQPTQQRIDYQSRFR